MKMNEMEQELHLNKSTLRYYERVGLLRPARKKNGYRHYQMEDVVLLKKIVLLRKIGVFVEEILAMQKKTASLEEVLKRREEAIQKQMEELTGALSLCRQLQETRSDFDSLDSSAYWLEMSRQEKAGKHFFEITEMTHDFNRTWTQKQKDLHSIYHYDTGTIIAGILLILIALLSYYLIFFYRA